MISSMQSVRACWLRRACLLIRARARVRHATPPLDVRRRIIYSTFSAGPPPPPTTPHTEGDGGGWKVVRIANLDRPTAARRRALCCCVLLDSNESRVHMICVYVHAPRARVRAVPNHHSARGRAFAAQRPSVRPGGRHVPVVAGNFVAVRYVFVVYHYFLFKTGRMD